MRKKGNGYHQNTNIYGRQRHINKPSEGGDIKEKL